MNTWEMAILETICWLGGEARPVRPKQICEEIPNFIELTEEHWEENTRYGRRPMYYHQVRSHIYNLCDKGELDKVARGLYRLNEKGRKRLTDEV